MKKGQRPSRHYRNVKTKKGKKKILINRKIKRKGTINKSERKVFKHLSNPYIHHTEFGGGIDFDKKGNVDNINVSPGDEFDVYLPPDFEVQYHTHPDKNQSPPTPDDVIALLSNKNQQAEIIFRDGKSFQIIKTPLSEALSKLPATVLRSKLDKAFIFSRGNQWEKKWKQYLESIGFIVILNNKSKQKMDVHITPFEPKRKK